MGPEQIIAAAMQHPGQSQEEVQRQVMHEHPMLTNAEIDRLLGALREGRSKHPIDAETSVLGKPASPKTGGFPSS